MKTKQTKNTRSAILEAAEPLFVDKGFSGTSMSAIAKVAGVNQSLISHHFGSKSGLFEASWTRAYERFLEIQKELFEQPNEEGSDILRNSIATYFRFLADNPEAVRLQAWLFLDRHKHPYPAAKSVVKRGIERLKDGQEMGLIRKDISAGYIWATFIGMAHGWNQMHQEYADLLGDDLQAGEDLDQAFLDAFLKIFFEGVGRTK